jgi:hypothetical protein
MDATSTRFDLLSLAAMKGLQAAEPNLKTEDAYVALVKCIADLILMEEASAEDKIGAANDIANWLVKWVTASAQDTVV